MPSSVGTSNISNAVAGSRQRKGFFANTRYWVFYSDGADMVFKTSTDGSTWSSPSAVRACGNGDAFSIWFDGTYVHYAYASGSIYYRRGTPNSNGTITWSAAEQTVDIEGATNPGAVHISVDSGGYPWIAYRAYHPSVWYVYVIRSYLNNGTWYGFPYQLSLEPSSNWVPVIVPLTSSRTYVIYNNGGFVYGRLWTGSAWGSEETVTADDTEGSWPITAVGDGDHVHFAYLTSVSYNVKHIKRTYGTGWGSSVIIQASTSASSRPTLSISSSDTLYCFWAINDHIYYKKYSAGVWDADPTDWITETALWEEWLTSWKSASAEEELGLAYVITDGSYTVRFALLGYTGTYKVLGFTKYPSGKTVGGCTVWLFKASGKVFIAAATSDPSTAAYSFTGLTYQGPYFLRAHKDGSPNHFGTTDDDIMGETE